MRLTISFVLSFSLSLILCALNTSAQSNYIPGYVINNEGDTINGLINYLNWSSNPRKIHFKNSIDSPEQVISPFEIQEFRVSDERYLSAVVEHEISPVETDLERDATLHIITDSVFIQTIIDGSKSLYHYKSPSGKSNYYIFTNGKFELLLHKKYIIDKGRELIIHENKRYVGQLTVYLGTCEKLSFQIKKTKYTLRSLSNLFDHYYSCSNEKSTYQKNEERLKFEGGIFTGGSFTSLDINGPNQFNVPRLTPSTNLTFGLSFNILLPRNHRKWSIVNELNFPTYLATGEYIDYHHDSASLTMGLSYIKMNNMLRYTHPLKHFSLFVNAGMGNGVAYKGINSLKRKPSSQYFNTPTEKEVMALRDYEQSIIAGAGLKKGRWSLEYRYEYGNGMSKYPDVSTKTVRQYVLLSFKYTRLK